MNTTNRSHGLKLIDFLQMMVPIRFRMGDKQLVSHDTHSNTYNYKYTFSVEIVPVCRDDLLCLPQKVYSSLRGIGPIVLCTRVTNQLTITDPLTLQTATQDAKQYWNMPYKVRI
jgi:nonsense-mediated mRNA decay protein 3